MQVSETHKCLQRAENLKAFQGYSEILEAWKKGLPPKYKKNSIESKGINN